MTTKSELLKTIRKHCLACCHGSYSKVTKCDVAGCKLAPFRSGKDPHPKRKGRFQKIPSTDKEILRNSAGVMV